MIEFYDSLIDNLSEVCNELSNIPRSLNFKSGIPVPSATDRNKFSAEPENSKNYIDVDDG